MLYLVVFITGACVLIIEIVALRILAPYFGNTIYSVSSVIGVVLAALGIGYFFGGKLADKYPSQKLFYTIIFLSGLSVLLLQITKLFLLPVFGFKLPITIGPLVSALILFVVPAALLGTLSPFAIKLQKKKEQRTGIGSLSGKVFFWSTFGSIFGSLASGFFLIPTFGINEIVIGVGVLLILIGVAGLSFLGRLNTIFILIATTATLITITVSALLKPEATFVKDGIYEQITIFDVEYRAKSARFLNLDNSNSAAMFINSSELVFDYTKYFVVAEIFSDEIENVLAIGGGAYSVPKAVLKKYPDASVDVSEIEPSLFGLAKKYFRLVDSPRLINYVKDGRRFLYDTDKEYDLIFSDVYYSLYSIPTHMTTREFFELAKSKLSDDGVFIANLIGAISPQPHSLFFSEAKTFRSVFPKAYFFATDNPSSNEAQNIIFVGYNGDKVVNFESEKVTTHDDPLIRSLNEKLIDITKFDLSSYPVLTDNYAPVEFLTAQDIRVANSER